MHLVIFFTDAIDKDRLFYMEIFIQYLLEILDISGMQHLQHQNKTVIFNRTSIQLWMIVR